MVIEGILLGHIVSSKTTKLLVTIEKELLVVLYILDKFRSYLMDTEVVVHTDHSALQYLMQNKEVKSRLIRWVLKLQEFDLKLREEKGPKNIWADHLSKLANKGNEANSLPIQESFPDEQLFHVTTTNLPWFADYLNFLVGEVLPLNISPQQKRKFLINIADHF